MPKKSKNLVTLNHLPGILLASEAECERWVEAGLIPVAERRTFQKRGRKFDAPMFDPDVVAELASQIPVWRAGKGGVSDLRRPNDARMAGPTSRRGRPSAPSEHPRAGPPKHRNLHR